MKKSNFKPQYISRKSYLADSTLVINPSKTKPKLSRTPKLLSSFVIASGLIGLMFFSLNVEAKTNDSKISEINNKINFIMNQISNNNSVSSNENKLENNIHDIILFILFGIFIILILEILYKCCVKITTNKLSSQFLSDVINNSNIKT